MRKSSKFIVVAGALAALAVPSVASANVAVENGVGHVDKSDVQTALKWNNSDFDKYADGLTFSSGTVTKVYNNSWICQDGSTYNQPRTQVLAQTPKTTAVMSSNGKQITGWDLTDVGSTKVLSDTGIPAQCPGSRVDFLASLSSPASLAYNTLASTTDTPGGLQVTGNGVTKDLPNTPLETQVG
jgi:hypothetical protein